MLDAAYNFAKTTISLFDSEATSATLTDPTRFLDPATKQYNCVVWCSSLYPNPVDDPNKEIVRFTAKSGSVYTFTRAQEGTEAKDHNIEDEIYSVAIVLTEKMISDIQDELDDKAPTESPEFTGTVTLENNEWLRSKDYSGAGYINILKVNEDNEIDVASQMNIGTIEAEEDAGAITLFDMPVSSASADGTEMSATIKIDGNNILKIYAEANGTGGADSFAVKLLSSAALDITETPATSDTDKFLVSDSNRIKYRTGAEVLSDIGGQASLGFTPENITNKKTSLVDNSDTYYPTQKAVKTAVDTKLAITSKASSSEINTGTEDGKYVTPKGLADQTVLEKTSNKKTTITDSNTDYPTGRAVKTYADGLVVGALNYRGAYDASGGTYPTTGGTGSGGAVMKGNMWIISVAGTLGGESIQVGDSIIANIDTPGQTASNWNHLNANVSYVPENIANKKTSLTDSDVDYPTCKAVNTGLSGKQNTLGFTPENVANKKTTLADNSDIYYPTQKAVKTAVDAKEPILTKGNLSGSGVITIDNTRQVIGGTAIISHTDSATVRHVTDTEKATWNAKQNALGFTPENIANKLTSFQTTPDDTHYPSEKLVKNNLDTKAPLTSPTFATSITGSYLTASEILITDTSKNIVSAPVATYPSLIELTYVKGVTSGIQSQLNNKANINASTTGSAGSLKSTATTGLMTITGPAAGTTRAKTIRDADDTILELGGSYAPTGNWTNMKLVTPTLGTPASGTLSNCSGYPAASTSAAGVAPQAVAPAAGLYNYIGITNGETAYTNKALFDTTVPSTQAFGDAALVGSAAVAARRDHKHAMMANPVSGTQNEIAYLATASTIGSLTTATYPSLAELAHVKGVTGNIQTQLDGKQASGSYLTPANIEDSIVDGHTTIAPSGNAVYDALALKAPKASPEFTGDVALENDKWLKSKDYSGANFINILKVNEDNEVDVGAQMNIGSIEAEEDAGVISLFDMPVSSASADGTEMSATIRIDGNNILKVYAEANGAGGVDNFKIQLLNKAVLTMQDSAGTTHTYTADVDGSLNIT